VIKYSGGLVKDEKQASYVIFGFVALAIIVSLVLVFGGGGRQETLPEDFINQPQFLP
jgi:acetylglutamate kinase